MSRLLVLDTETGGLDPEKFSLLSIGMVVLEGSELGASDEFFVAESELRCEPEAMAINGIDIAHVRRVGLAPDQAVARLEAFLDFHFPSETQEFVPVAGHNVYFDVAFVRRLYRLAGRAAGPRFSHRLIDTAGILQFLAMADLIPRAITDSSKAFRHFGVSFAHGQRHSALADASATARLLTEMIGLAKNPAQAPE